MKNFIKKIIITLVLSLVFSHYSESLLTPPLKKLKHFLFYGQTSRFDKSEEGLKSYYSFLDEPVYNPVHIIQQAFGHSENFLFSRYLNSKNNYAYRFDPNIDKHAIVKTANWMLNHYKPEVLNGERVIRLVYSFDYPTYDLKAPWYSGMAQGMAIVLMVAAHEVTGDIQYLEFAHLTAKLLTIKVEDGGTLISVAADKVWHEEYADSSKKNHPMVLNGNNCALDGLFWLSLISPEEIWKDLLIRSIVGLELTISKYDTGLWSKYCLMDQYANAGYHDLHIQQLVKISDLYAYHYKISTPNIKDHIDKFKFYKILPLGFTERILFQRNNLLFIILFINFTILSLIWIVIKRFVLKNK